MGRHREWRKIAKRERRRRIRTCNAKLRDRDLNTEEYIQEQELLLELELENIQNANEVENEKWIKAETVAIAQWERLQQEKERAFLRHQEHKAKLKLEWEEEQKQKKIEEEKLKIAQEEQMKKQERFLKDLDQFLSGDLVEPPSELNVIYETRPSVDLCPFYSKTACCRFGDQCSRNHQNPAISKVLLAPNFYTHFGLDNANLNEYDTDIMLEYEDTETYKEFKEFFNDVLSEFEKFGKITQFRDPCRSCLEFCVNMQDLHNGFESKLDISIHSHHELTGNIMPIHMYKVCNNHEKHLRGNTYIEYAELRCAVAAYRALHTRWYGGRQLSLKFCLINSWKNAVCGLQIRRRCPKGRACNFLHVFRNPNNLYSRYNTETNQNTDRTPHSSSRSWRWSESPERDDSRRISSRSEDREKRRRHDSPHHRRDESSYRRSRRTSPRRSERRKH